MQELQLYSRSLFLFRRQVCRWNSLSRDLIITLESVMPPVKIEAGEYELTLVADAACTQIPSDLRTRYLEIAGAGGTVAQSSPVSTLVIPFSGSFGYCVLASEMGRNNCYTAPVDQKIAYAQCLSMQIR